MPTATSKAETLDGLLSDWCERAGLDDADVARMMQVSRDTVGNWRRLESAPNWRDWPKLAQLAARRIEDVAVAIAHGATLVTSGRDVATDSRKKSLPRASMRTGVR